MQTLSTRPIAAGLLETIRSWPGVVTDDSTPGVTELRLGSRELGHFHGDHIGHLPLPPHLRDEVIASGAAAPHPMFPNANWVEIVVNSDRAAEELVRLFRVNYDRFQAQLAAQRDPGQGRS